MKRLLICTIMRNARPHLERYADQLAGLREQLKDHYEIDVSIYENDSTDGTAEWLQAQVNAARLWDHVLGTQHTSVITTETLGTKQYGSVWSLDRLRNLALARQKCLDQVGDRLQTYDKVAYVEVDVTYNPRWASELILARHPLAAGLGEPDIYSGWSLRSESNPKESTFLYDTCATRQTLHHTEWRFDLENAWRPSSVIPTDLGGHDAMCLHRVWSTFNCFCVYNARPFAEGMRWSCINHRLDTGQGGVWENRQLGHLDADTAQMCEQFRAAGHDKVFLNTNCLVRHA